MATDRERAGAREPDRAAGGDIVFVNGHVMTGSGTPSGATAVAVRGGRIVAVGSDADALAWRGRGVEVIDLKGRTITPGFNDAHCHPMWVGFVLQQVNAATPPNRTIADLRARIAERVRSVPPGTWVLARGYDQARLADQRHPTRHDLDPISPDHPVLVVRACGHIGVANSRALALASIDRHTPDPEGGTIDRDAHGEPTGVVREAALALVRQAIPAPTREQIAEAIRLAGRQYLTEGVTSFAEAGIRTATEMRAYLDLAQAGELPVRTYLMMMIDETLEPMTELGLRTGFGDAWLRIGPAKLFLDGSIGGRTARMSQPYEGEDDNLGLWMQDPTLMKEKLKAAHRAGFQCCAHAIGDAAIELLIMAYEEALAEQPRADHRHRIEHCSILRPDLIDRIQRLGAIPVPGTTFLWAFHKAYVQNLGMDRIRYAYAMRTFFDRGIVAPASSDAPVDPTNPMIGIQTMVTRRSEEGVEIWPEERITLEEAIRAYTYNGAYASFEEDIKGSIAPGKLADLTVLETDLRTVPPEELAKVRVDLTVVEGRVVYVRGAAS
ncbi:MAG: amidohydrolase [Sphaerobacter sp.]|nr:amidohydrolase [Sphaerobacter sp.]